MVINKLDKFFDLDSFIVFGAGDARKPVISYLKGIGKNVEKLSDNNEAIVGEYRDGVAVVSPDSIKSIIGKKTGVVIASSYQKDIYNQLVLSGIDSSCIFPYMTQMFVSQYGSSAYEKTMQNFDRLVSLMEDSESVKYLEGLVKYRRDLDPSYLSRNLRQKGFYDYDISTVSLRSGDVVVDCGAYTGDTAMEFLGRADDITVYAVEGMSRNYDKLQNWISSNGVKNVIPIKKFLGDQRGTIEVFFEDEAEDPRSSFIIDDGKAKIIEKVDIATLDALFYENAIEFDLLKIDVEGADLQVIKGGGKSIQKCAPKIMAAAYHVLDHLWLIPDAVRSLNKDYKIYAGHHDRCIHEIEYYCGI